MKKDRKEKTLKELLKLKKDFQTKFYGARNRVESTEGDEKIKQLYEKYGDDFSINVTILTYETLTGKGKVLHEKNIPIGTLVEELKSHRLLIDKNVLAFEVYAKGVRYGNRDRKYSLGGPDEEAKIFCDKVVFGKKVDPKKLGYFADALICTREEFSSFSRMFCVRGYEKEEMQSVIQ